MSDDAARPDEPTASEVRAGEELISALLEVSLDEIPGYAPPAG
jgi:hypothetical protein